MQVVLVMRQLAAVLDQLFQRATEQAGLTPQDVLVFAWMVERPGISAAHIAYGAGRARQNVQRTLERLEALGLAERYPSAVRNRAAGWGLTSRGSEVWEQVERVLGLHDQDLVARGVNIQQVVEWLGRVMAELMETKRAMSRLGLKEPPPPPETPEWDL